MSDPVSRIRLMMESLPKKDISLGYKFLHDRDFESLKELVDSAIYKVRKNLKSSNPKEEYLNVKIEDLSVLKAEVDTYLVQLRVPEDLMSEDNMESIEDIEDIEDSYY